MDFKMWVWDEISGECKPLTDRHPLDCSVDGIIGEVPDMIKDGAFCDWQMDHVIDLPDGTRLVIESDERAHTAVIIVQPEGDA
jgi:hypothetical protein